MQCKQDFDKEAVQLQGDVGAGTTIEPFAESSASGDRERELRRPRRAVTQPVGLPAPLLPLAARSREAAFLVDFDGSIAAIVDDPAAARVLPPAREALGRLIGVVATVAVVSGRPVEFLARAIGVPGLTLVGQYGLERMVDGRAVVDPRAEPYLDAVASAAEELERELPDLHVERKAGVAVTVHWRTAAERESDAVEVVDRIAGATASRCTRRRWRVK